MGFFDTVTRLTITEVFKALAEVNSRLTPDETIVLLQQAEEVAADDVQPKLCGLFRRIDREGMATAMLPIIVAQDWGNIA